MSDRRILSALFCALAFSVFGQAYAQSGKVHWQEIKTGRLWIALHQSWGEVQFSAVKFHLGYYKLNLVDVRNYRDSNIKKIRDISDTRKFSNELLDAGINTIFRTWSDPSKVVAVSPAGWSTSLRRIDHSGLLKISDKQLSDFDDRESLSAIICLHSPSSMFRNFDYQVPTFFKTSDQHQLTLAESCRDAVQVGPRIIEDPDATNDQRGIPRSETNLRRQLRVIFALDDPGRKFPPNKPDNKRRENARNCYLIVTDTPAHLWDVQEMLVSPAFYGAGSKPHWAVNLAGGGPSGLLLNTGSDKNPTIVGNPSGVIGSAFVITEIAQ